MIIDTLRPTGVADPGGWTAQPSGTLDQVTSDDSDTTYAQSVTKSGFRLTNPAHSPAADHQRHAVRARLRGRVATGTGSVGYRATPPVGGGVLNNIANLTTIPTEFIGSWSTESAFGLASGGPLNIDVIAGGSATGPPDPIDGVRIMELYVDIDTRHKPTFTPEILDGAGVDQSGGTITDTNIARTRFTATDYDGLPERTWRVAVYTLDQTLQVGFEPFVTAPISDASGNGGPVDASHVLPNDDYVAYYQLFSTIRTSDAFASDIESVSFTVDATGALAPANLTVTPQTDPPAYVICWDAPADAAEWDEPENVYTEITRIDCNGTHQIALIPDGIDTCYTDRFAPLANQGSFCDAPDHECEICYEVRYWGYRSVTLEPVTTAIPQGVVLAWPDTDATIPTNWTRVAALDGRYPKGVSDAVTDPGANGGAATHGHVLTPHDHSLDHNHAQATTGAAPNGVPRNALDTQEPVSREDHVHTRPTTSTASVDSQDTTPTVTAEPNEAPRKAVVFVESDGVDTAVPAGMLAIRHASGAPSGWQLEDSNGAGTAERGPYWKGAAPAGDGSLAFIDEPPHDHPVPAHTHAGTNHGHTSAATGAANTETTSRRAASPSIPGPLRGHTHPITVSSQSTGSLASGGLADTLLGAGALGTDPLFRATSFIESITGPQFIGLIGIWLGPLANIPLGWLLCDGANGTPDFLGRYPRHKGALSVNLTGGGASHGHGAPANHGHTIGLHAHTTTLGAAAEALAQVDGAATPNTHREDPTPHAHASSASTEDRTPGVGTKSVGATSSDTSEPEHTEVAFIMLAESDSSPTEASLLVVSDTATFCVDAITNPVEGCDWLRGFIDGDICICPDRSFARTRPFGRFQPIAGGFPIITSGTPGGRDYSLSWGVESEADLELCESILAQVIVHFTPADQRPLFMAPDPLSVEVVKVDAVRLLEASFYEVDPPPIPDPADVIPEPAPSSPSSP